MQALMLVLLAAFLIGPSYKKGGVGDTSDIDLIITEDDLTFIKTARFPGNLNPDTGMRQIFVSPDATGELPQGYDWMCDEGSDNEFAGCNSDSDCNGTPGTCTSVNWWADRDTPLETLSAAAHFVERNGCGTWVWFDSGDTFDNGAIGDSTETRLSETGFDLATSGVELDCNDSDNRRVGLVLAAYPPEKRVTFNFAWQSANVTALGNEDGTSGPEADIIVKAVAGESSATVIGDAASIELAVDELIGGKALVTDDSDVGCALTDGDIRTISDNDADTITVDTFGANETDDCVFTIVTTGMSNTSVGQGHFEIGGTDEGQAVFVNLDVYNSYEDNTFSCSNKDPSVSCAFWGTWILSSLDNGSGGPLFHMNSPTTDFFFQSGARNITNSIPLNTSGSVLSIGSDFIASTAYAEEEIVKASSHAAAFIDTRIYGYTAISPLTPDRNSLTFQGNTGVAGEADLLLIRSVLGGSKGTTGDGVLRVAATNDDITSLSVRMFLTSLIEGDVGLSVGLQDADTFSKTFYGQGLIFDRLTSKIVSSNNNQTTGIDWCITDSAYDDTEIGTNDWDLSADNINTRTLAEDDVEADTGTSCCGVASDCSAGGFFSGSDDLANSDANVGSGGVDDMMRLGTCHEDNSECYQATTLSILENLNSRLCLNGWELPSGEKGCVIQINPDGNAIDRGGSW